MKHKLKIYICMMPRNKEKGTLIYDQKLNWFPLNADANRNNAMPSINLIVPRLVQMQKVDFFFFI